MNDQQPKVYLTAQYSRVKELRIYRDELHTLGYNVQARWLDRECEANDPTQQWASEDWDDLRWADTIVVFTDGEGGDAKRHVEFGMAVALQSHNWRLRIVLIGPRECIFHYLPKVRRFNTWPEFRAFL